MIWELVIIDDAHNESRLFYDKKESAVYRAVKYLIENYFTYAADYVTMLYEDDEVKDRSGNVICYIEPHKLN